MIRKYLAGALLLGAAVMLTGCTTEYDNKDIESYVKENTGLKEFTIENTPQEVVGEDGYTDKIWTVWTGEKAEEGFAFHVIDDYRWSGEALFNDLNDDYEETVFLQFADQLPESTAAEEGLITIEAGSNVDTNGINEVSITASFTTRTEIKEILEQITLYREFFQNLGYDFVDPYFEIQYEGPDSSPCKGNLVGGWCAGHFSSDMDKLFQNALNEYILAGLDYRFEEVLADTTEEEQQEVILADETYRLGVVRDNGETEYYDDLIGGEYGYGLNVSTLYQVLEREGLNPAGDERHFTCVGADGTNYEFSCDFVTADFAGGEGAYYLADGEPVKMGYAYNIHINAAQVSKMFGLNIVSAWNKTIAENGN